MTVSVIAADGVASTGSEDIHPLQTTSIPLHSDLTGINGQLIL